MPRSHAAGWARRPRRRATHRTLATGAHTGRARTSGIWNTTPITPQFSRDALGGGWADQTGLEQWRVWGRLGGGCFAPDQPVGVEAIAPEPEPLECLISRAAAGPLA